MVDLRGTNAVPNPGTMEAISRGCTCPVIDNGHGRGWRGGVKDDDGETIYVYNVGCPVHAPTLRALDAQESGR